MSTTIPKERIIFQNYDLREEARAYCEEYLGKDYTEQEYYESIYAVEDDLWGIAKEELEDFFKNIEYIGFFGEIGRWNGVYKGGKIDTGMLPSRKSKL